VLGCLPLPAAVPCVIAIDDLEVSAGQELFGRWHRHLWRLGAQWVVIGGGDDPTPYLDAGADDWWEDGILPVPALGAAEARELVLRRLHAAGVECPCPDQLIAAARGNRGTSSVEFAPCSSRRWAHALPRGYTDRYMQRYTEGPNVPCQSALPSRRALPQQPPVGPSP